jgi:hypothetical protein
VLLAPFQEPYWKLLRFAGEGAFNVLFSTHPVDLALDGWRMPLKPSEVDWEQVSSPPAVSASLISANVPLTFALILATPGITLRRRLRYLALSCAVLFLTHVFNIVVEARTCYMFWYRNILNVRFGAVDSVVTQWLYVLFQHFRAQLFPFLIWAVMCYREILAKFMPDKVPQPASRRE